MKLQVLACLLAFAPLAHADSTSLPLSRYAGQETRDIKSLSPEEVDAYLSGKGIGLARVAELNGYAGPRHVLELSAQLDLTPEQRDQTEALFAAMQSKASALGRMLVEEERNLDHLFASKTVTPALLASSLARIGSLQSRVRRTHLQAHLAQVEILTPEQNARYPQLRGYAKPGAHAGHDNQQPGH